MNEEVKHEMIFMHVGMDKIKDGREGAFSIEAPLLVHKSNLVQEHNQQQ